MKLSLSDRDFYIFDGAMGTALQSRGLRVGERSDVMNIRAPEAVYDIHRAYAEAGSDIICTNTFGANRHALANTGLTVADVLTPGVEAAKRAAGDRALVALDIGPIGEFMRPMGTLTFTRAYDMFAEQAILGEKLGVDLAAIETMSDLCETRAAILAVRENTSLPIFVSMTFDKTQRTYLGVSPGSFARMAQGLGVAALGINCSLTPSEMTETVRALAQSTSLPIIVKPNAGLPDADGGYGITPEEFARQMEVYASLGAKIVGGCCGSNPEFIARLRETYARLTPSRPPVAPGTFLATATAQLDISGMTLTRVGASACTTAEEIAEEAASRASDGESVVPVYLPQGIAPETAFDAVTELQAIVDRPLNIICGDAASLEQALRASVGIPAVTCPDSAEYREIAARYGAVFNP